MECLRDYIGIKGCSFATPASNMYINTLAGMELAMIDQIANADQSNAVGVWADIQERAIARFRLDVIGKLSGFNQRYKLRQITQTVDLGKSTSTTTQAPVAKNQGLVIELMEPTDAAICSNMQSLYVQNVSFYLGIAGNYSLIIRDADTGVVQDTIAVTGVVGWNNTLVDKQYDGVMRLSISVDCTAITTMFFDLSQFNLSGFDQSNWCADCGGESLSFGWDCTGTAQVRGYSSDVTTFANPTYGLNTFGISCVFSVKCTYNNVVCTNKRHFATAFRLVLGIELMTERLYTSRLNKWTTVDLKRASQLRDEYEAQYRGDDEQYEGELDKACGGIELDLADCCLQADAPMVWRDTQL